MRSSATLTDHDLDNDDVRRAQQRRLRELRDVLVAEGAKPEQWAQKLSARADSWPE